MANVFIVEDNASHLRHAKLLISNLGVREVDSASTVGAAVRYLDEIVEGKREAPALMILDLALGYESGFEVLRRWKGDPHLKAFRSLSGRRWVTGSRNCAGFLACNMWSRKVEAKETCRTR